MNDNERTIIGIMAERITDGGALRGTFALLHEQTAAEVQALCPNLMRPFATDEQKTEYATALKRLAESEKPA